MLAERHGLQGERLSRISAPKRQVRARVTRSAGSLQWLELRDLIDLVRAQRMPEIPVCCSPAVNPS